MTNYTPERIRAIFHSIRKLFMTNYTPERIRAIFHSISSGVGNHGSFLMNLANTVLSADSNNFNILKPSLEEIIEKYNLNKEPYIYVEND